MHIFLLRFFSFYLSIKCNKKQRNERKDTTLVPVIASCTEICNDIIFAFCYHYKTNKLFSVRCYFIYLNITQGCMFSCSILLFILVLLLSLLQCNMDMTNTKLTKVQVKYFYVFGGWYLKQHTNINSLWVTVILCSSFAFGIKSVCTSQNSKEQINIAVKCLPCLKLVCSG